jgi:hypothetical protein
MGIITEDLDGYQPICDKCGICLCYKIGEIEYSEHKEFWDSWICKECKPNYLREYMQRIRMKKCQKLL